LLDALLLLMTKATYSALSWVPHGWRVALFSLLFRLLFFLVPRMRTTIHRNLLIAFPNEGAEWRKRLMHRNATELGRLVADAVRLPRLDERWVREHVTCPMLPGYLECLKSQNGKGLLIATGHLGSFELLGHAIGLMGHPLAAVARSFRSARFDAWWRSLREARGNTIIGRKGAFKAIVSTISEGKSVAVLFDQNVTRNHAVFVDWFGCAAATSKSLALAVLRCEVPVFVAAMRYCGDDRYEIMAVEVDFTEICASTDLSTDEKVYRITAKLSSEYEALIRTFPEGWFWMHRRWKTRPEGEEEDLYSRKRRDKEVR
jgi:KDO2-lipid IV(A) lauroyltransferase